MQIINMPNINTKHGFATDKIEALKYLGDNVIMLKQEHSADIIEVTNENINSINNTIGDGLITQLKNVILTCYVGDCACIFIHAKDINTIAIVHSGWSGTFNYINEKMIIKLQTMGANLKNLSIAIGPSIAQESYQVGDEFYEKFIKQNKDSQKFFIKINNKWHYNNAEYIAQKYHAHDIENIFINKQNTYTDDDLFSHRYYTHFGKKNGRMLGFIML